MDFWPYLTGLWIFPLLCFLFMVIMMAFGCRGMRFGCTHDGGKQPLTEDSPKRGSPS